MPPAPQIASIGCVLANGEVAVSPTQSCYKLYLSILPCSQLSFFDDLGGRLVQITSTTCHMTRRREYGGIRKVKGEIDVRNKLEKI